MKKESFENLTQRRSYYNRNLNLTFYYKILRSKISKKPLSCTNLRLRRAQTYDFAMHKVRDILSCPYHT